VWPTAGLGGVFAAEALASVLGFAALVHQARVLGPVSFARVEYAAAVAAWLLVLVRGGVDVIVYREAARRIRLVGPLTDLLIGLRCVAAVLGYALVLAVAALVGPDRGRAVAVAGLVLFAAAWVADVGPRATGRLGWVALAQGLRAVGFTAAVLALVRGPGDATRGAACLVLGEAVGAGVTLAVHASRHGFPRPRWRRRASLLLARRGAVAALTRFGRVTLYGADLLALGWWAGSEVGPYAAARRLVFALVALGLVVPAVIGPALARAWAAGSGAARERVGEVLQGLWTLSLPAAVGIGLTADRWMLALFGEPYRGGGPWLALVAARLPWLLAATFAQSALVACRREGWALRLVLGKLGLAALLIPASALAAGPWGVGWAALALEAAGAIAGWAALARLGVAPGWAEQTGRALVGCLGLVAACRLTRGAPLPAVGVAGAFAYGAAWRAGARFASLQSAAWEGSR
jgi:O-antigen/teichoic acid export membrane protein